MNAMKHLTIFTAVTLLLSPVALGLPYEFSYFPIVDDGAGGTIEQFPEEQGWERNTTGNVDRSIDQPTEAMTLSADEIVSLDFYVKDDLGPINPAVGELLYVEWSMWVEAESHPGDNAVGIALDDFAGIVAIDIQVDRVLDVEGGDSFVIAPGVFHTFFLLTSDLLTYDIFVDGAYAFSDLFKFPTGFASYMTWGDGSGTSSTSHWQFVRYGAAKLGDTNTDGRVNLLDFATFATCFGGSILTPPNSCTQMEAFMCDLDGNGLINLVDFATLALNFDG